jgi:carotenoid cleavage dioxygenase-like enzyme
MVIFIRGMFGTQKAGGILKNAFDLRKKNVANTNILYWGQKLVALWEGGLPHSMDPISLETIGESTLGGVLGRGETLTAHPRYDPVKARQIFFSADVGPITTKVRLTLDWQTRLQEPVLRGVLIYAFDRSQFGNSTISSSWCSSGRKR